MALSVTAHLPSRHSTPRESSVTPHHQKAPASQIHALPQTQCTGSWPGGSTHPLPHPCFQLPRVRLKLGFIGEIFMPPSSSSRKTFSILSTPKARVCISDASENKLLLAHVCSHNSSPQRGCQVRLKLRLDDRLMSSSLSSHSNRACLPPVPIIVTVTSSSHSWLTSWSAGPGRFISVSITRPPARGNPDTSA